jgi:hypothetical protein
MLDTHSEKQHIYYDRETAVIQKDMKEHQRHILRILFD